MLRGINGKTTPTAANFDQMIHWLQLQFLANQFFFIIGGLFQAHARLFKYRAGIHHAGIQEQLEKVIAQVIMLGNILTAAINRVFAGFVPSL